MKEVLKPWRLGDDMDIDIAPEQLILSKGKSGEYYGSSAVHDYVYRPNEFEGVPLYEWLQKAK